MMFSILSSKTVGATHVFALNSGQLVSAFSVSILDVETCEIEQAEREIGEFLKSLDTRITLRVWLKSEDSFEEVPNVSRGKAVAELGYVVNQLYFIFEMESGGVRDFLSILKRVRSHSLVFEEKARAFAQLCDLRSLENIGMKVRSLNLRELESLFVRSTALEIQRLACGVDLGHSIAGVVRLVRQGTHPVSPELISSLKDRIPLPFKIAVSVRRLPNEKSESLLRRKTSQTKSQDDQVGAQKYSDTQEALTQVALYGSQLFEFEFLVELQRSSESDLRRDAELTIQALKPLGDIAFETFGARPSFMAAQIGGGVHVGILENERVLPSFLPIWSRGRGEPGQPLLSSSYGSTGVSDPALISALPRHARCYVSHPVDLDVSRTLLMHRRDQSLHFYDVFDPALDNFSVCIFGRSGRGKSVLTNLLTRALHNDSSVMITKIDVGGSHSKETELLGGVERKLGLREPSGLNPFGVLRELEHSEDICNIISQFLFVLLLEEGETSLSKAMKAEIEREVSSYSALRPLDPTLDHFLAYATGLPRRALLERWAKGGIYANAFRSAAGASDPSLLDHADLCGVRNCTPPRGTDRAPRLRDSSATSREQERGEPESDRPGDFCEAAKRSDSGLNRSAAPACSQLSLARLTYFNLSEIFQAGDSDFAQGILAAVVAEFNLGLLREGEGMLAGQTAAQPSSAKPANSGLSGFDTLQASGLPRYMTHLRAPKRHVFVCDESPFFIEKCFSFFKFSTANVRKFGGSFITIAQKSSDVVINGDPGILENSATKFLFSVDGEKEAFASRLRLTPADVEKIESLTSEKGVFSEVALVDAAGVRTLRVQLTNEEYWNCTSSKTDNDRLQQLRAAVPDLSLKSAIGVLACLDE